MRANKAYTSGTMFSNFKIFYFLILILKFCTVFKNVRGRRSREIFSISLTFLVLVIQRRKV